VGKLQLLEESIGKILENIDQSNDIFGYVLKIATTKAKMTNRFTSFLGLAFLDFKLYNKTA
jgi:hypothetical protein